MRVVKEHDERLNEFLEAAIGLMAQKGYERTTIQDIIDAVGVSKGAFYHYFSSKEDILNSIAEKISVAVVGRVREVIGNNDMPADEKLRLFLALLWQWKVENFEVTAIFFPIVSNDENLRLKNRVLARSRDVSTSILQELVEQGVREGVLDVRYPAETVDIAFLVMTGASEATVEAIVSPANIAEKAKLIRRHFAATLEALERILGARPGSLGRVPESFVKKLSQLELRGRGDQSVVGESLDRAHVQRGAG